MKGDAWPSSPSTGSGSDTAKSGSLGPELHDAALAAATANDRREPQRDLDGFGWLPGFDPLSTDDRADDEPSEEAVDVVLALTGG